MKNANLLYLFLICALGNVWHPRLKINDFMNVSDISSLDLYKTSERFSLLRKTENLTEFNVHLIFKMSFRNFLHSGGTEGES